MSRRRSSQNSDRSRSEKTYSPDGISKVTSGITPIDERPQKKRRNKRRRATVQNHIEGEEVVDIAEDEARALNEQINAEHREARPKKRAGTTGQPGYRKNYVKMNANRVKPNELSEQSFNDQAFLS